MAKFTDGELEVMRILWKHGALKPAEIQEKFPRSIKNSALRSYLTILLEKGHVVRSLKRKAYYYKAKTKEETAFRSMSSKMVDAFCNGSTKVLIANLIKSEKLSEQELLELKRLAYEELESEKQDSKKKGKGS